MNEDQPAETPDPAPAATPEPIPDLPVPDSDPEAVIGLMLREQARLVLGRLLALTQREDFDLQRAMQLVAVYTESQSRLIGEFRAPIDPMPGGRFRGGMGGMALPLGGGMGGGIREMMTEMSEIFSPAASAQRLQGLAAAYRSALEVGDNEMAGRLRQQINAELGDPPAIDVASSTPPSDVQ